jgi:endogenous inhibitor of DNA gyrase (YacG/DUF329 family)
MMKVKCKKCGKDFEYPDVYGIPLPANPRCPKCGTPAGTNAQSAASPAGIMLLKPFAHRSLA